MIDDLDKPTLREQELYDWLYWDVLDGQTDLARRRIHYAILEGEIVPTKLSGKNYFSRRDGLNWLAAQKGKYRTDSAHYRAPDDAIAIDGPRRD